jgi:hypothetical protein
VHRHLRNIDCLSFVMCLLLAQLVIGFFSFFFLLRPLKVLMKQTRQAVCTIKQSIILRCLWVRAINQSIFLRCLWLYHLNIRNLCGNFLSQPASTKEVSISDKPTYYFLTNLSTNWRES